MASCGRDVTTNDGGGVIDEVRGDSGGSGADGGVATVSRSFFDACRSGDLPTVVQHVPGTAEPMVAASHVHAVGVSASRTTSTDDVGSGGRLLPPFPSASDGLFDMEYASFVRTIRSSITSDCMDCLGFIAENARFSYRDTFQSTFLGMDIGERIFVDLQNAIGNALDFYVDTRPVPVVPEGDFEVSGPDDFLELLDDVCNALDEAVQHRHVWTCLRLAARRALGP